MSAKLYRLLVIFLLCTIVAPAYAGEIVDRIVGMANGEVITLFEVNERVKPLLKRYQQSGMQEPTEEQVLELKRQILNRMLDNILVRQEAERLGITVSQVEVDNQISKMKRDRGLSDDRFDEQLRLQGMTRAEYADEIKADLLRKRLLAAMVANKVVVTEEEIAAYYANNQNEFQTERKVDVSLILLKNGTDIDPQELRQEILQGEQAFEQAARTYSIGPGAEQGGALGELVFDDLGAEWKEALQGLEPGEISQPFSLQGAMAIVKIDRIDPGDVTPVEAVKEDIYQLLYNRKIEEQLDNYLERLRSKAVMDIRL